MIDRILSSRWALRVLALVLTLVLYSVTTDSTASKTQESGLSLLGNDTEVITGVPVKVLNDSDGIVISGVPSEVTMEVKGSRNVIKAMEQQGDFSVVADLQNVSVGTQIVKLEPTNLPEGIEATVTPAEITVTIQEKITKEFNVEPEISPQLIATGYKSGPPTSDVDKIKVTGPRDTILNITAVKAKVTSEQPLNETTTIKTNLTVLDNNYNKITNVQLSKKSVEITVPISKSGKSIPISLIQKGEPKNNLTISSLTSNVSQVTLEGDEKELDKIKSLEVPVDVSDVSGNIIKKVNIQVPDSIKLVSAPTINVTIRTGEKVNNVREETNKQNEEVIESSEKKATDTNTEVENNTTDEATTSDSETENKETNTSSETTE
ncbi:CdaR family protein [Brochothrix thermosphacta]|uniref:CdaR family protein n=1 Tax=Brochothrix thermosphacta TaxID=2756 RepID=UPI000D7B0534|nr:CdaR family protein [Brochothrix thermosphacta]SPN75057.1 putative regulator of diadenylate cyclase activity [Brochothrix thermosphacta]